MRLMDLEPGSEINIEIQVGDKKMGFKTHIKEQIKNAVIIEAIRIEGKFLSLNAKGVKVSILYFQKDQAPLVWEYVSVPAVIYKGESCYKCTMQANGVQMNRRETYRLFLGVEGIAQVGTNRKALSVLVKDISDNGFSFVHTEDMNGFLGEPVRIVFDIDEMHFNLQGCLVRVEPLEGEKYIYGCKLIINNPNVSKYIAKKQREMLAVGRKKVQEKEEDTIYKLEEAFQKKKNR